MESVNNILEDGTITEKDKLEKVYVLLNTKLEDDKENINTNIIFNFTTENIELKYLVLKKAMTTASNIEENIEYFMNYFQKTYTYVENVTLLAKLLKFIFENKKEQDQVQNILNRLGTENVNKVLLSDIFLQRSYNEADSFIQTYLKYLQIVDQAVFLNNVFELSKVHRNVEVIYHVLQSTDKAALVLDKSILRNENFWVYLTYCLVNSEEQQDTTIIISVLQFCINLAKRENIKLNFTNVDGNEDAWIAFFALIQIFAYERQELLKPSLQLLSYVSLLHYFWQHCVYKLLMKRAPNCLKCDVLASIVKQKNEDKNLTNFLRLIFPAINERKCYSADCPVFTELSHFCEDTNVGNLCIILDEVLNVSWDGQLLWRVLGNVLVDSKKNLVDFGYLSRILSHLHKCEFLCYQCDEQEKMATFFYDPENIDFWKQIRNSSIPFALDKLPLPEKFKNMAMPKLIELTKENCDDLSEIEMYLGFLKDTITHTDIIKYYPVGIHVRLVIYRKLFTMCGYIDAQHQLDQENTVNDFHEYLINHLNERNYIFYKELMINFLDLMDRFMGFMYPKKACTELLKIILNPELYSKYQIYCSTEILRIVSYRFNDLSNPKLEYYQKIAQKWKYLILETEDSEMCKLGLYYVLEKGQLDSNEYNGIVRKLLKKHFCDDAVEEIYNSYLNADLMNFAYQHLMDVKTHNLKKYEKLSELFCKAVVSENYITSDYFSCENEEYKLCCLNSKNLERTIFEVYFNLLNYAGYEEFREKVINLTIEIYLNKLRKTGIFSNLTTKEYCLHILLRIVSRFSLDQGPPVPLKYFKEDIKWIMNRFKEKYAQNLKNDVNRLRIVQGLYLLVPYVRRDLTDNKFKNLVKRIKVNIHRKLRNILKRIAVGILVKESDGKNSAARQICQHMYILLCEHAVTFEEIKCIVEKVKEQPNLACSFMPVLYHVMPLCKFNASEMEEIFASLFLLVQTSDNKLGIYTQILLQHVGLLYNNKEFKNIIEKYSSRLEKINLDIERNKNEFADVLMTDRLFLEDFDPVRDHSLETVLSIFPKLNKVDSSEWEGVMKHGLLWNSSISEYISKNDTNETFKKAVEEFLETEELLNKYINYSAEDILEMFRAIS